MVWMDEYKVCCLLFSFLVIYSKQPIFRLTQEWFRELPFSGLACGVHDRLHINIHTGIFFLATIVVLYFMGLQPCCVA